MTKRTKVPSRPADRILWISFLLSILLLTYCLCSDQRYYAEEEDDDVFDHNDDEVEDDDEDDDDIVCLVSAVGYTEVTSQARVLSEYSLSAERII